MKNNITLAHKNTTTIQEYHYEGLNGYEDYSFVIVSSTAWGNMLRIDFVYIRGKRKYIYKVFNFKEEVFKYIEERFGIKVVRVTEQ